MGVFVALKEEKWTPPIKSKLLKGPTLSMGVTFDDADLKEMVDKQRKAFDAEFKKFEIAFKKLRDQKVKDVQSAVDWTEDRIAKKNEKEMKEVVETANKMLQKAWQTYEDQVKKLAQDHFDGAIAKSYQVMKAKLRAAKAKAIVKIAIIVGLTLTAAALAIAASVVTGGATIPLAVGAAVVGIKAAYDIYKTVDSGWSSASNQMKIINKDIDELKKATGKLQELRARATTGNAGAVAAAQKLKAALDGKMIALDKHVGQLDKFIFQASQAVKKANAKMNEINDQVNKSGDADLKKKAAKVMDDLMQSIGALRAMDDVKVEAAKIQTQWKREQTADFGRLEGVMKKVNDAGPFLSALKDGLSAVYTAGSKLQKALAR